MAQNDLPETQEATQSQLRSSNIWSNIESQPVEPVIWGRLHGRKVRIKSLDLCQETFSVGRAESNDLTLNEEALPKNFLRTVSKIHFEMKRQKCDLTSPVFLKDLSRHGTFVNGEKVGSNKKYILQNGDVISLYHPGCKAFVFKDLGQNESQEYPMEIRANYYVSRKLGAGACGEVRLVYNRRTCLKYAMKHVQKNRIAECSKKTINDPERVMNEAKIMKELEHPCVIKMHDIIDKPDSVFMVLEFMKGGDLLSRIISEKRLSERISKLFFLQMCHAVKYLHDKGITHRDLKPDNVLLETEDDETLIKISDFGLSKFVKNDSIMKTLCGTPLYVAPEVLLTGGRESYTKKVDIWSLGVVLFTCLSGTLPFSDEYGSLASEQIIKGKFSFSHSAWREISPSAKGLILDMLTVNETERPGIDYVLKHKWLKDSEVIGKCRSLMKLPTSVSDDENFLEPPAKRRRH